MGVTKISGGRGTTRVPQAAVRAVHELFVGGQVDAAYLDSTPVRRVVAESWQRSLATGVDPDLGGAAQVAARLDDLRATHPLASALPVIRKLLVEDAIDSGVVVAVTAADGTLLWVEGDRDACRKAEAMNFVPGADWSERSAGTNAPALALALDCEQQIRSWEHFSRAVQPWNCSAAPIHDPATGMLLGAIDLTGGSQVASRQTLALVRATAVAVENHLALLQLSTPAAAPAVRAPVTSPVPWLSVLGAERPRWHLPGMHLEAGGAVLTGRHADILVLLLRHREGVSADHLAMLLDDKDLDVVTIRAEMSRLRRVIGTGYIGSRPYRLLEPVASDIGDVSAALERGDVDVALSRYRGELLPQSVSPAIGRLRTELSASLRSAVLAASAMGDLTLLRRWLDLPESRDDREAWRLLHDRAPAGSVARAQARGHLAGLDFDLS